MITSDKLDKPDWLSTIFQVKGAVLSMILPRILFFCILTAVLTFIYLQGLPIYLEKLGDLTTNVIYNLILGLLIVFRTNTSYERFWEGRKAWGGIVVNIRNLAQEILIGITTSTEKEIQGKKQALNLLLAFAIATKLHLRGDQVNDRLEALVEPEQVTQLKDSKNRPLDIQFWLRTYLHQQLKLKNFGDAQLNMTTGMLNNLTDSVSGCERILTTPIPITYRVYLKRLILIYCFGLPFRLVPEMTWWAIPIVAVVSFLLLGVEEVARELENPFGFDVNDLPLDDLCDVIEGNLERVSSLHGQTKELASVS
ncbi:bestrophin family protein [Synechococcus sp. BDU 130192]|uniref:bestrophin family protein n=1 Tax=Synechococcus sp. BDU 130192 TaxID=2042059 RepID=UPI000C07AAA7|nr:bestrophin family ion channel [Synechococcus sp. BDU 130192]